MNNPTKAFYPNQQKFDFFLFSLAHIVFIC